MKNQAKIKRNTRRIYIFTTMSMISILIFGVLVFNHDSPSIVNALPYLLIGDLVFMGITTMCAIGESVYVGKSYDMDHCWVFPTIGFNNKTVYIIWLRFEIFVTY